MCPRRLRTPAIGGEVAPPRAVVSGGGVGERGVRAVDVWRETADLLGAAWWGSPCVGRDDLLYRCYVGRDKSKLYAHHGQV